MRRTLNDFARPTSRQQPGLVDFVTTYMYTYFSFFMDISKLYPYIKLTCILLFPHALSSIPEILVNVLRIQLYVSNTCGNTLTWLLNPQVLSWYLCQQRCYRGIYVFTCAMIHQIIPVCQVLHLHLQCAHFSHLGTNSGEHFSWICYSSLEFF